MPATAMAAEPSPWTALAANRHVNEPDIENTEGIVYGDKNENNMPKGKYSRKRGEEIQCHRHKGQSSHNARSEHPP